MPDSTRVPITPRSVAIPDSARVPFEARRLACEILRTYRSAALATLDPDSGYPYGSVTDIATDHDGAPVFLLAGLALHTRNIAADNRVSLVLANLGKGDALAQPRLTLVGRCHPAPAGAVERLRARFLRRHPKAKLFLSLPDVCLFRLGTEALQLSAGPGRNAAGLAPSDLITDLTGAQEFLDREQQVVDRLNDDQDLLGGLCTSAGLKQGRWKITGIDPEGLDLACGDAGARLWFDGRVTADSELEKAMAALIRPA